MDTPGMILRRGREARGLTVSDLSRITRIPEQSLLAIEADEFDALPAEVFARGFMRNFARQVSVSEVEVIRAYEAFVGRGGAVAPAVSPEARPAVSALVSRRSLEDGGQASASSPAPASGHGAVFRLAYAAVILIAAAGLGLSFMFMGTGEAEESDFDFASDGSVDEESPFLISNTSGGWAE